MTLSNIVPSATALTEEAQGELLAASLFSNVASQRFAHQRRNGNTFAARQGMEFAVHGFFNEKCGSFHMTCSSIRRVLRLLRAGMFEVKHNEKVDADGRGHFFKSCF